MSTIENLKIHKRSLLLMGNIFDISISHADAEAANEFIDIAIDEIQRIELLLSTYKDNSETTLINVNAGIKPVKISKETFDLIERCIKISHLTQGAFDISYGSIDKSLWNFDKNMSELPSPEVALQNIKLINFRNIMLSKNEQTIFLKEKGMRIGFGGIGKGYAAERARTLLKEFGVSSGIINASGDLATWGKRPDGQPYTIGIADPNANNLPFSYLQISDMAVATSGNYEKFVTIGGKKYSHTIDPRTGYPICGIKSATVICANAEIADALTTPIMVMGIEAGLSMINQIKNIGCLIIDDHDNLYTSENIKIK